MAVQYKAGETKIRPGFYERYSAVGQGADTGARDGMCAIGIKAPWGPLGQVVAVRKADALKELFGSDPYDRARSTVEAAKYMFTGGAQTVYVVRMGTGGKQASLALQNEEGTQIATVRARYPGTRKLAVSIQEKLGDPTKKIFTVYDGTAEKESFPFDAGEAEPASLAEAVKYSALVEAIPQPEAAGAFEALSAASGGLTGGEDPVVTNESYSQAWALLEPEFYNTIALDVDDKDMTLSLLLREYLEGAYETGKKAVAVVGEPSSVQFPARLEHARNMNSEKIVYLGGGYVDAAGNNIEGVFANCLTAGIIAATPSNESITHRVIKGAVRPVENLTNTQYEDGILSGALLLSTSAKGAVWFDSGVNTLTVPGEDQDDGWKKIRRTKTRFETFDRIDRAVAPKIGRINCDSDGIAEVIQTGQGVLDDMVKERKYHSGVVFVQDPDTPATSDSAWFKVQGTDTQGAVDIDSLEKAYLHYLFQSSVTA